MKNNNQNLDTEQLTSILNNAVLTQADFDLINSRIGNGLYIEKGRVKQVLVKRAAKQNVAHIDWLNFTFQDSTLQHINADCITDFDIVVEMSKQLQIIFDISITSVRANGANFYDRSYEIGDGYGLVCHGGQNNTMLVSLNGEAFKHMADGWENRLYRWLSNVAELPTITRIDLAHDIFDAPLFTVDHYLMQYEKGGFSNGNRLPSVSQAGNWITPDDKGRTLYIGRRTNGLFCRIYEKGLDLSSKEHPSWVRIEVEIKSVDRIVPLDVLLAPHEYLSGTYPCLRFLSQKQVKIKTIANEIKSDINHRIKWGKRQNGSLIKLLEELEYSNDQIIEVLKADKLPKKFMQRFIKTDLKGVHQLPRADKHSDLMRELNPTNESEI